jgi:hypothetical protein
MQKLGPAKLRRKSRIGHPPQRAREAPCARWRAGYRPGAMVEPGFVTLTKIVGTLLLCMGIIPFLFLLAPGDRSEPEPKDTFDGD